MRVIAKIGLRRVHASAWAAAMGLCSVATHAASENDAGSGLHVGGYVRSWTSFNLDDQPETAADDRWEPSMVRGSAQIDIDAFTGPLQWKLVGRADLEAKTDYLKRLQDLRATNGTAIGGRSTDITDNYDDEELREFWVGFKLGERAAVRIGRQQIVWGESDFFQALDLVHGYDFSWRLFLEGENEDWRKPLWLISGKFQVPQANGQLHAFVRPGLDRCEDIGNSYDIRGGRWFFQPYRGYDLTAVSNEDCDHPEGDRDDVTGGVRWEGEAGPVNYSLAWVRTFAADPVANSAFAPYKKAPSGAFFDLIHPIIDVFGATVSGYNSTVDAVFSAEMAYVKDQPYNVGQGPLLAPSHGAAAGLGLGGIMTKDALRVMLRLDKNINFQKFLGTTRPSLSSIQLFDTMVLDYRKSDDLVRLFAYGSPLKRHSPILTVFTVLNYRSDTINPGLAAGVDLENGGGFVIPSVEFVYGDNWRLKAEADIFWADDSAKTPFDPNPNVQLFGYFDNNSQLVLRLTRQF